MEAEYDQLIEIEEQDGIAVVRMVRGKGNALNTEFLTALVKALDEVELSPARALVITGEGRIFSAGVDLSAVVAGGADYVREFLPTLTTFLKRLALLPKPVVAAVNGHAMAGGCIGVLACDSRPLFSGSRVYGENVSARGSPGARFGR
jgi:enoyl-CoA hydratase